MVVSFRRLLCALGVGSLGLLAGGCGSNLYELAEVTGTVTCNGEPALGGWVIFQPIDDPERTGRPPGEPGGVSRGIVKEDGSFTLTMDALGSNEPRPGALIGPCRVAFMPPRTEAVRWDPQDNWLPEEDKQKLKEQLASYEVFEPLECGTTIAPGEVEVVDGANTFEFTLSGPPIRPRRPSSQGGSD
jgi:hypothetical protein